MARAQTYIITDKYIYGYSSELHDDNHKLHLSRYYKNLQITEYIPFLLSKKGECVIDLISHGDSGSIYLPEHILPFQESWILDRESYLKKYNWCLSNIVDKKMKAYDMISFEEVKQLIISKKQL